VKTQTQQPTNQRQLHQPHHKKQLAMTIARPRPNDGNDDHEVNTNRTTATTVNDDNDNDNNNNDSNNSETTFNHAWCILGMPIL
jgi:hypothetical protein